VQVWKLFPVVAAAVESMQPGAQAAAASFIAASVWDRKAEQPPAATVEAEQAMLQQASVGGAAAASPTGNGKDAGTGSNSSKSSLTAMEALASGGDRQGGTACRGGSNDIAGLAILRPSAALEAQPRSAVRRVLARAGLGAPNFLPALHMGVLFAACGSLTVIKPAYLGLGQKADWVAFTGGWRGGGWVAPGAWKPLACLHASASCTSSACCTPRRCCRL
jgi:hypothetical protein